MAITGLCAAFFRSRARADGRSSWVLPITGIALRGILGASITVGFLAGCEPKLNMGEWTCKAAPPTDAGMPTLADPIALPWSTSFENPFCDYLQVAGSCYHDGPASPAFIVTHPTHSGRFAAAFTVVGNEEDAGMAGQTRCIRQGTLPNAAYYGAWYFVPANATNTGNWNLLHFRGGDRAGGPTHPLWDVSLVNTGSTLTPRVLDFMPPAGASSTVLGRPVPVGSWFHLVFFLRRAKDATGEVALYQEGVRIAGFKNRRTDDSDWGQWYVGNYATMLDPPESTVYVDDVTIEGTEPTD